MKKEHVRSINRFLTDRNVFYIVRRIDNKTLNAQVTNCTQNESNLLNCVLKFGRFAEISGKL